MQDYEIFDVLGISFDPLEKGAKKIQNEIKKRKEDLGGMLGSMSQEADREAVNEKLRLIDKLSGVIIRDGKTTPEYAKLGEERKELAVRQLESRIQLEEFGRTDLAVTKGKIKAQKLTTRLSAETIEGLYRAHGFEILDGDPMAAMPKFPTNVEKITNDLALLRKAEDLNPNAADRTIVYDMYGFVAYLQGEPERAAEYKSNMSSKDLVRICDEYAVKNSSRQDSLGKLCNALATAAKTYIFNTEANRTAYDQYLLYRSPELTKLFAIIKGALKSDLYDPTFAETCIKRIQEVFGDTDVALAIYNNEAGLKSNPYTRQKASFSVKCGYCGNVADFSSYAGAQRINRCPHCGKELYKKCKSCGKTILSSLNRCPECGFIYASASLLNRYLSYAETALKQGKLEEARDYITRAKGADPTASDRIAPLEKKLEAEENRLTRPLNKLKVLMTQNRYEEAERYLGEITAQFPAINLSAQKAEIEHVLKDCWDKYNSVQRASRGDRIAVCSDIIKVCVDFSAAIEYLNNNPPEPCGGLEASGNDNDETIVVTWQPPRERGVVCCLLRKEGKYYSSSPNDGQLLYKGSETSFVDKNVEPGTLYCYTLFFVRAHSVSKPTAALGKLLLSIKKISTTQSSKSAIISWHLPKNCAYVAAGYKTGGKEYALSDHAHESVELTNLQFGAPYTICLRANYGELGNSAVSKFLFTPTPIIESFNIASSQNKDGTYSVSWSIKDKGIDLQILLNGRVLKTTRSETKSCTVELPQNSFAKISVNAFSGGNWVPSANEITINTYQAVQIYSATVTEKSAKTPKGYVNTAELTIKMCDPPANVTGFYCYVRTKQPGVSGVPWVSENELKESDRIDIETYSEWREIKKTIPAKEEDAYYVTVYTVFDINGRKVVSAPAKKKVARQLKADIYWSVTKGLFGPAKIAIEMRTNFPCYDRPALILCSSLQGRTLLSPDDPSAVKLGLIKETTYEEPKKLFVENYEAELGGVRRNERLFMFVRDEKKNESYAVRWAEGFDGRL